MEGPIGLVLDKTSFYAESGGQVCDVGVVECVAGSSMTVEDTKAAAGFVLHVGGAVDGVIAVGDASGTLPHRLRVIFLTTVTTALPTNTRCAYNMYKMPSSAVTANPIVM